MSPDLLRQIAQASGVDTHFWDCHGQEVHVSDDVLVAVLAALGISLTSDEHAHAVLHDMWNGVWRRAVAPTIVQRVGQSTCVSVFTPAGQQAQVRLCLEDGNEWLIELPDHVHEERSLDDITIQRRELHLPDHVPVGYHTLRVAQGDDVTAAHVITVPQRISAHPGFDQQRHGMAIQLYSVLSSRSWGLGDFADLASLSQWAATHTGADFVLINPIHAAEVTTPLSDSPYLPSSRRFINPLYIRCEDIREASYLAPTVASMNRWTRDDLNGQVVAHGRINRDATWTAKSYALQKIYNVPRSQDRQAAFDRFKSARGEALRHFAIWCALGEKFGGGQQGWPEGLQTPDSPAVAEWAATLADRVEFFCWLQWIAEEQLANAQLAAKLAGMRFGVLTDLAVGVHPLGADAWTLSSVLAQHVSVGAPPDAFNQIGQNWSQPPWRPDALARTGYQAFIDVVRAGLRHSGGLRVDHVMGMFRLWWIPEGFAPSQGTYVRFDHEAMVGIVCLEAERAGAVVIGEDLGTVEPWVREHLESRGILGTSVLWFEQQHGHLIAPEQWRELCFATVTTHDLPPSTAYLSGDHVTMRHELGVLAESLEQEQEHARAERELIAAGMAAAQIPMPEHDIAAQVRNVHAYLARTPSLMVAWSLTDAVGDRATQNVPGTFLEYPNWCIPLRDSAGQLVTIEQLGNYASIVEVAKAASGHLSDCGVSSP